MKSEKRGISRILAAFRYSMAGIQSAWSSEEAFRQEAMLYILLLPAILLLPFSGNDRLLLFLANTLVLIVELLNSALESIVDLVSPDFHPLAKNAKDMGSAAVFFALVTSGVVWAKAIFDIL